MSDSFLHLHHLFYRWTSQVRPLFTDLSAVFEQGWTGLVGSNGCGKTTLLNIISGDLVPESGDVLGPAFRVICDQRTDEPPPDFMELAGLPDSVAGRWASILGISSDWPWRWDELSHGERKRAQVATALWRDPEILMVDEPTNHLDRESRLILRDALRR